MERFKMRVDPLLCADVEFVEFDKNCCANCCKPLNSKEKMDYVVSSVGAGHLRIKIAHAISVVFEMAKKLNPTVLLEDNDIQYLAMCSNCHSIFAELFNSYKKFLKMTEAKSYIRKCVRNCVVWDEDAISTEILPDSSKENKTDNDDHLNIQFEVIKLEEEKVPFTTDHEIELGVSDSNIVPDDCNNDDLLVENVNDICLPDDRQKPLSTALHVEKIPLIKMEKLSIEEVNLASNWNNFLERGFEYKMSLEQSNSDETACKLCDRKFSDSKLMKTHFDLAHKKISKPLSCQLCNERFSFSWFHKHHVDIFHSGIEIQFMCKICDKVYKTLKELNHHKSVIHHENLHPFRCNYCEEGYQEIEELRDHLLERHSSSYEAKTALENKKHISQNQNPTPLNIEDFESSKPCLCSICGTEFIYPLQRDKHVRYFHEKKTACVFCEEVFSNVADCKSHETKVHDSYNCPKCKRSFPTVSKVNWHLNACSGDVNCEACGKSYPTFRHLKEHYKWHIVTAAPPKFICHICSKSFSLKHSYNAHMKFTHAKERPKYDCLECQKTFYAKSLLQQHNEKLHGLKSSHKCRSCDRTFSTQKSLIAHSRSHRDGIFQTKLIRTGEGEFDIMACYSAEKSCFVCSICDAQVGRKDHFVRHVQRLHISAQRVPARNVNFQKCGTCEKTFESQEDFLQHLRTKGHRAWISKTHISLTKSQIESYECDVCGKFVKGKYHFQKHQKIHNPKTKKLRNKKKKKSNIKNETVSENEFQSDDSNQVP